MACFIFSALIVLLDQLSKMWIVGRLPELGDELVLIPGVFALTHVENPGASLGILSGKRWLLVGIASACAIMLIVLITQFKSIWSRLGLAAVLGGALGNLLDRIMHEGGVVVDMFKLDFIKFVDFPIFNVADCFITIGFIIFCLSILISNDGRKPEMEAAKPAAAESATQGTATPTIFGGAAKDLSETKILEEYDIERLLREYNNDENDD